MIKFKEIKLCPSEFTLDVYVTKQLKELDKVFTKKYGFTEESLRNEPLILDACWSLETGKDCDIPNRKRFCITLRSLEHRVIVHEVIHLLWHMSEVIGYEMNYTSQEWQAIMGEYVFNEILKDDYSTIS